MSVEKTLHVQVIYIQGYFVPVECQVKDSGDNKTWTKWKTWTFWWRWCREPHKPTKLSGVWLVLNEISENWIA